MTGIFPEDALEPPNVEVVEQHFPEDAGRDCRETEAPVEPRVVIRELKIAASTNDVVICGCIEKGEQIDEACRHRRARRPASPRFRVDRRADLEPFRRLTIR